MDVLWGFSLWVLICSMAVGNTTMYYLYIAFGFLLIPMEHNFMGEKKN